MDITGLIITLATVVAMLGIGGFALYKKYYVGKWFSLPSGDMKYRCIGENGKPTRKDMPFTQSEIQEEIDRAAGIMGVNTSYFKSYSMEFCDWNLSRDGGNPMTEDEKKTWEKLKKSFVLKKISSNEYYSQSRSAAGSILERQKIIRVVNKFWSYDIETKKFVSHDTLAKNSAIAHELLHVGLKLQTGGFDHNHTSELWKKL